MFPPSVKWIKFAHSFIFAFKCLKSWTITALKRPLNSQIRSWSAIFKMWKTVIRGGGCGISETQTFLIQSFHTRFYTFTKAFQKQKFVLKMCCLTFMREKMFWNKRVLKMRKKARAEKVCVKKVPEGKVVKNVVSQLPKRFFLILKN